MRIAMIGLGAMGGPMAANLAAAPDVDLVLFDADPARLAAAAPLGRLAGSVAEAAGDADLVFTVLPADRHLRAVAADLPAANGRARTLVDFSTVSPATVLDVARDLAARGVGTISVTLTRGTQAAERGELTLFVGAERPVDRPVLAALDAMATDVRVVGGLAAAKALKIANNMLLGCLNLVAAEAVVLGRAAGLPAGQVVDLLGRGGAGSWALRHQVVPHMLTGDLAGRFSIRYMAKDMRLFLDLAAASGAAAPLAGLAAAAYRGACALGHGDDYHPVVIRWVEATAGLARSGAEPPGADSAGAAAGPQPPGATRDPMPDPEPPDAVPEGAAALAAALAPAVAAVQFVASRDALRACQEAGLAPGAAVTCLTAGSAGNDALPVAAGALAADPAPADRDGADPERRVAALTTLLAQADVLSVPALTFQVAHDALIRPRR